MSILPESIRSMSRMSLIRRTSRSVFSTAISTIRWPFSGSGPSTPDSSSPSEPRIEVSGVRSSWLTIEVNSSFARSTSRRSVMSCAMPCILTAVPSPPMTTSPRAWTMRTLPSECTMRWSKEKASPLSYAVWSSACTVARSSGCTTWRKSSMVMGRCRGSTPKMRRAQPTIPSSWRRCPTPSFRSRRPTGPR